MAVILLQSTIVTSHNSFISNCRDHVIFSCDINVKKLTTSIMRDKYAVYFVPM